MTDHELEQELRAHYRQMDPGMAPRALSAHIDERLARLSRRPAFFRRIVPILGTAFAAVVLVAVVIGLRPDGFLSSTGASGTPLGTAAPTSDPGPDSPPTALPSPSPTPAPTFLAPGGSFPPISATTWGRLDVQALPNGPTAISSLTTWSGGYIALGQTDGSTQVAAWISVDGRSWVLLPAGTFGRPQSAVAAPAGDGVIVAAQTGDGGTTVMRSTDGQTWTSTQAPQLRLARAGEVAGNSTGAVAMLASYPYGLAFSADGTSWQTVVLPGPTGASVNSVTAFGSGFVAVGDPAASSGSPEAWTSADGVHWSSAHVDPLVGDGFSGAAAGANGLVAWSTQPGYVPGLTSFWTSADGRAFTKSGANPLGIWTDGAGSGGSNGLFLGDGTHLLGYGRRGIVNVTEYWASLDGTSWTHLVLSGDTSATIADEVTPFVLRDGILFIGAQASGTWFGAASP